jgi:hypothetical protein
VSDGYRLVRVEDGRPVSERRTVDATGDRAWFWTRQAETALDMNALNQSVEGRDN